jgi:hypothetical protein
MALSPVENQEVNVGCSTYCCGDWWAIRQRYRGITFLSVGQGVNAELDMAVQSVWRRCGAQLGVERS